jgi:hypothetical protein
VRDVHARRNRSQIGFRLTTFASSSLQILARVSSSSHLVQSKGGHAGALWRARWRCRSEVRGLGGDEVAGILINREG